MMELLKGAHAPGVLLNRGVSKLGVLNHLHHESGELTPTKGIVSPDDGIPPPLRRYRRPDSLSRVDGAPRRRRETIVKNPLNGPDEVSWKPTPDRRHVEQEASSRLPFASIPKHLREKNCTAVSSDCHCAISGPGFF